MQIFSNAITYLQNSHRGRAFLSIGLSATAFFAGYQLGELPLLLPLALGLPIVIFLLDGRGWRSGQSARRRGRGRSLASEDEVSQQISLARQYAQCEGLPLLCIAIELDCWQDMPLRHGLGAPETVAQGDGKRMRSLQSDGGFLTREWDNRIAVLMHCGQNLNVELALQPVMKLQAEAEEPTRLDASSINLSDSAGQCLSWQIAQEQTDKILTAAVVALDEGLLHGPSEIQVWSEDMRQRHVSYRELRNNAARALENGQIQPWFQPQISTDTGRISGFEALARWEHPDHGSIPPGEFLGALEGVGLQRLGEVILYHSLSALKTWDAAGFEIPHVGINFSSSELRNPKLTEKILRELDRFDLTANRLGVEVLETVVARAPEDIVARNINRLADMGCLVDLDDFGTGHASIASIPRFNVARIKIDRSFVMNADRDPDQRRLVAAILTMAERLELETVAEGVETEGEHALLSQLGCTHVQGFGIARPMPFEQTLDWIRDYEAKLADSPQILRKSS